MAAAHPGWLSDEDGRRTWPVNRYAIEGERRTDWFAKGVRKYHRRIGTTLNALIDGGRSEEHTSELQSLMRISYAVFCLKNKNINVYQESTVHSMREPRCYTESK